MDKSLPLNILLLPTKGLFGIKMTLIYLKSP